MLPNGYTMLVGHRYMLGDEQVNREVKALREKGYLKRNESVGIPVKA